MGRRHACITPFPSTLLLLGAGLKLFGYATLLWFNEIDVVRLYDGVETL